MVDAPQPTTNEDDVVSSSRFVFALELVLAIERFTMRATPVTGV
jgi:hypothetical protein